MPGMGSRQIYRIVDALIDSEVALSYSWRSIEVIPPGTLPPKSLIVALTTLLDERTVVALLDLRARRFDLAVVEVMVERPAASATHEAFQLAHRMWRLDHEATLLALRRLGIPIVRWRRGEPLQRAMAAGQQFERWNRWLRA
jgi:uncharacterized protein (DUF58 family)